MKEEMIEYFLLPKKYHSGYFLTKKRLQYIIDSMGPVTRGEWIVIKGKEVK